MAAAAIDSRAPIEIQLDELRQRFLGAQMRRDGGATVVTIPEFQLPPGWNKSTASIHFVLPAGYPHANPDCFNADKDLRLADQSMPRSSQLQNLAIVGETLWFSWHLKKPWKPNRDNLVSWVGVVHSRFLETS